MKKILALAVWIAALGLLCASCDNGLDIQQAYTFSLETMPVQKRISVGETVEIRDGKVYINGSDEPLDDSFVPEVPTGNYGPYKVPENSYFMLGDNREYSRDSRFWKNTFVSFDEIVGKAVVRYYPSIKLLN